jgi:alpha-glucosidase
VAAAHERGLKVILDFVPNHSSDRHPWFVESRSTRASPKRDWYIWRDPGPDGGPPNNWLSNFGGPGWEWDEATEQYYYHAFLKEQPDLNWRNPEVRAAMLDVLRFWFERGVDGFRIDVIYHLMKDETFRDNPPNPSFHEEMPPYDRHLPIYSMDRPEVHDVVAEMRCVSDAYDDRILIGEIYLPIERLVAYYGENLCGVHLPFNFQLLLTSWSARRIAALIHEYETALPEGGWPNWVLGNHDNHRVASRIGRAQARVAALLLLTLRGTPTIYYGDEIGMTDVPIPPDRVQDPFEKRVPGIGVGRDPERTPMQWEPGPGAGFTAAEPWLPIAADADEVNVARLREDPRSILHLHRRLIALRRAEPALAVGGITLREAEEPLLAYERHYENRRFLVVANLGGGSVSLDLPPEEAGQWSFALSTHLDREGETVGANLDLRGDEAAVLGERPS